MSKVGDFRNFCLDSCCKYIFRLNPTFSRKFREWVLEGFVLGTSIKYILVYNDFETFTYPEILYMPHHQETYINTVDEVKKTVERLSKNA
jgi:hypothetical protein